MVAGKLRIRNLVLLRPDIDAMTELKPLTYDEHKAAEAARPLYAKLSAAVVRRAATTPPATVFPFTGDR